MRLQPYQNQQLSETSFQDQTVLFEQLYYIITPYGFTIVTLGITVLVMGPILKL